MSYLVFDIETVPDLTLWTPASAPAPEPPATDIAPAKKRRTRKAGKDEFPPLYAHRPIAIGYVMLDETLSLQHMGVVGTSTFKDDEKALLQAWSEFMAQQRPTLVSYNGRGFDMPVISLRALRHGVGLGWHDKSYRNRYSDEHIDLMEQITEFGAVQRAGFSLDTMSIMCGLPAKGGMDGSKVASMFRAGEIGRIEQYATVDAAKTAFLFMRWSLMRGRITLEQYRMVSAKLLGQCGAMGLSGAFLGADLKVLLLEG